MNKVSKKLRGEDRKLSKLQKQTKDLLKKSEDAEWLEIRRLESEGYPRNLVSVC